MTTLFGEVFTAKEALAMGMVHRLVAPEDLLAEAVCQAKKISPDSFSAYSFSKHALQRSTGRQIRCSEVEASRWDPPAA